MAYKVIILYRLYMPSYVLGTFTEYPKIKKDAEFFIKNSASFFASCRTAAYAIP